MLPVVSISQTQVIKGVIKDADSEELLPGVNIILDNSEPFKGSTTDLDGEFRLEEVPVGRQSITITYIGYKTQSIPNILVTAGKEVYLEVKLVESVEDLKEVVITADSDKDKAINELAKVSARTFSPEEVNRFSGGRNDVARLASNFAGVNAANDSRNDIIVRGNSPTGLLWRIEGIPVANTNHFATLGTTGGPVSALNTNMLKTSDFITGAFPAEYGNANAAVFDVNFRNGNPDKYEFTAQASAFSGLEFMAEGPLSKKKGSSFMMAYRYGMASLAATGTSAIPYYQDFSFKFNFGQTKIGSFQLFGLGGLSHINFYGDEIDENDLFANPNNDAFVNMNLGLLGLKHVIRIDNTAYIKTSIGTSVNTSNYDQDNIIRDENGNAIDKYQATELTDQERRYTLSSMLNKKFSSRWNMRTGILVEVYNLESQGKDRDNRVDIPDNDDDGVPDYFIPFRNVDETTPLYQVYGQAEYKFTDNLSATAGLHGQYLQLNDDYSVEPRAAISWQFRPRNTLSLAYGLHSQMVPLPIVTYLEETSPGVFETTNNELTFYKSHHVVLGYDKRLGADWRLKLETYYQSIFDMPVERFSSSYNAINEGGDFIYSEKGSLISEGTGSNVGAEITVEKFFSRGFYMLTTTSIFDSKYKGSDGIERNTSFNNGYVFNILAGKEFAIGKEKRNALTFDTKFTTSGGRPYTPIDLEATRENGGRTVYYEDEAFSLRYDEYLRLDLKFGIRLNSKIGRVSHTFFVDLQNVTSRENIFVKRYNPVTDQINDVTQTGFFPDFMYRIQF